MRQFKVVWSAKDWTLDGIYFYSAPTPEAALRACRLDVMDRHGVEITVVACSEVVVTGLFSKV